MNVPSVCEEGQEASMEWEKAVSEGEQEEMRLERW